MNTIKTLGLSLVTAGLLVACGGSVETETKTEETEPATEQTETATEAPAENVNPDPAGIGVQLDNGQPWTANPETTKGIAQLSALVDSYDLNAEDENPELFSKKLTSAFGSIIKNCTMKGEAHEQLHSYLMPMQDMFSNAGSENFDTRKKAITELKSRLEVYDQYFTS